MDNNNGDEIQLMEEVVPIEIQVQNEIKKFSLPDAAIAQLKEKYSKLEIADRNDRAGYDMVKVAISDVRSRRTGIEAKRKELKSDYIAIGKAIDREAERLTNLIQPLEDYLKGKKELIDNEIAEEKRKEEEARLIKKNNRIAQLQKFRMTFYDGKFRLADIALDPSQVEFAADEIFNNVLENIEKEYQKLIAAEKQEEEKRIADQQELERLRNQEAEANKIIQENRQRELKAIESRTATRVINLKSLGLIWDGVDYVRHGIQITLKVIKEFNEEDWDLLIENVSDTIKELNELQEANRLKEQEQMKQAAIAKAFQDKELKDQQEKQEAAERLEQGNDKSKFGHVFNQLQAIEIPIMASNKGKKIAKEVEEIIKNACQHIQNNILKPK